MTNPAFAGYDLRGSSGQITISTNVGDGWLTTTELLDPGVKRAYPQVSTRKPLGDVVIDQSTTQRLIAETRDALLHGGPVISMGRDGLAAIEACIAALISAKEGRAVQLPLKGDERNISVPNR
jgi:hypothetical protein